MRVPNEELAALPLEAHTFLAGVPLEDVNAIDLPNGGPHRTIADVRALMGDGDTIQGNLATRALFRIRWGVGRALGWDHESEEIDAASYVHRLSRELRARSTIEPGTRDGPFRVVYALENEVLSEIRNATVHAFLCATLAPMPDGYRLYWGVYVAPVSRLTGAYMAVIDPFRRLVVYPSILGRIRRAWIERYGGDGSS